MIYMFYTAKPSYTSASLRLCVEIITRGRTEGLSRVEGGKGEKGEMGEKGEKGSSWEL